MIPLHQLYLDNLAIINDHINQMFADHRSIQEINDQVSLVKT
jgi:hypothetical protein